MVHAYDVLPSCRVHQKSCWGKPESLTEVFGNLLCLRRIVTYRANLRTAHQIFRHCFRHSQYSVSSILIFLPVILYWESPYMYCVHVGICERCKVKTFYHTDCNCCFNLAEHEQAVFNPDCKTVSLLDEIRCKCKLEPWGKLSQIGCLDYLGFLTLKTFNPFHIS